MKKVQEVVRSMKWLNWVPGGSVCYKDTSYSKTHEKVRFKFLVGFTLKDPAVSTLQRYETELRKALKAEGHDVARIHLYPTLEEVLVYQEFELEQPARRKAVPLRG